jgi:hypothetical protein
MGGGRARHESMDVRNLEQSQLSTAANNVEIASKGTIQNVEIASKGTVQIVWVW